jgi:putative flippase GtrA
VVAKQIVRILTVVAAELAYLGLVGYFAYLTWNADTTTPSIPGVQTGAATALAVALGAGYALAIGVEPQGFTFGNKASPRYGRLLKTVLVVGIFAYFFAGVLCCVTYAFNDTVTPGIVKALAAGFGGYVIAYLAQAYRDSFA